MGWIMTTFTDSEHKLIVEALTAYLDWDCEEYNYEIYDLLNKLQDWLSWDNSAESRLSRRVNPQQHRGFIWWYPNTS